jgi:pimeloyl-ACP methyl ester carboxylesterase
MASEVTHRKVTTNGIEMHLAEAGAGPLVLFCHGFPECWYSLKVMVPALYIAGDRDPVLKFPGMDRHLADLPKFVPQLRPTIMLPGCGHLTGEERPAEVNTAMVDFLRRL